MKTKLAFLISLLSLISFCISAQNIPMTLGLRSGEAWGFTCRIPENENTATEGMFTFRDRGMQLTILKEQVIPVLLKRSSHFFAYYGFGGHFGYVRHRPWDEHAHWLNAGPVIGVDYAAGLEYRTFKHPLSFALEYKPYAELSATRFFRINLWDFAFTFRYTLNK